jgi:CDP-4-dehydro-6-deoxyglucose reductase
VVNTAFQLHVAPGQAMLPVKAGQTLLDATIEAGLHLTHSCQNGYCGSCRARLLAGAIEYPSGQRVSAGVDAPEIMLCIARPRCDVTIEPLFPARA